MAGNLGDDAFLMLALLAVASAVAFMGPGGVTAPARRCVTAQAPRTMRPVAGVQLNPNEQMDIRKELSDLKTRLLSVEQSIETRAVNTNRTNAMAKTNLKENQLVNYDDVSRSPLPSPMPRARLATPDPRFQHCQQKGFQRFDRIVKSLDSFTADTQSKGSC